MSGVSDIIGITGVNVDVTFGIVAKFFQLFQELFGMNLFVIGCCFKNVGKVFLTLFSCLFGIKRVTVARLRFSGKAARQIDASL